MQIPEGTKNVTLDGYEICILCSEKAEPPVLFNTPVDQRTGYVEGCGQTCANTELCHAKRDKKIKGVEMKVRIKFVPGLQSHDWFEKTKGLVFKVVYPQNPYSDKGGCYVDLGPLGYNTVGFFYYDELEILEETDKRKLTALMTIIERIIVKHRRGLVVLDEASFKLFELAKRAYRAEEADEKALQMVLIELANFKE